MNQEGWKNFIALCLECKNGDTLSSLFELFFTQEERESIATRYLIIYELLKKEKTQRIIADDCHVSIAKITRGSNELKRMSPELIEFLKKQIID